MNGLQRTMLGTLMAGAATFGVGTLTGCQKQADKPLVGCTKSYCEPLKSDIVSIPETIKNETIYIPKYVTVHDTVYIPKPEYKFDIKIPRLIDLVENARKSQAKFLENGLKFLRKIR